MKSLIQIADETIPVAFNKKVLKKQNGNTGDIIAEVLSCYVASRHQVLKFAPSLLGKTDMETLENIWKFWKQNIRYQVDELGVQWIKTPAAVWTTKFCDCKSFSVAVASCLKALGIHGKFRFVSFGSNKSVPTHVYCVAIIKGVEIPIDCVWTHFNSEKPFTKKWDYRLKNAYAISQSDAELPEIMRVN